MSPEKTEQLINIFPELFSDLHPLDNFYLFGFECGDGWFELLSDLIRDIKSIYNDPSNSHSFMIDDEKVSLKVGQVKEKYGTLRFYLNCYNGPLRQLIERAQDKSEEICEECGRSGSMRERRYWYSVRCDDCWSAPHVSKWA